MSTELIVGGSSSANEEIVLKDLKQLACDAFEECLNAIEVSLRTQLKFGRLMLQIKSRLKHGEFVRWVNRAFGSNKDIRTIQRCMKGASVYEKDPTIIENYRSLTSVLKSIGSEQRQVSHEKYIEKLKRAAELNSGFFTNTDSYLSRTFNVPLGVVKKFRADADVPKTTTVSLLLEEPEPAASTGDAVQRIKELIRAELSRWPEDARAEAIEVFEQCVGECSMELGTNTSSLGVLFPDAIEPVKQKERITPTDEEFEAFYKVFPRRVNKAKAKLAFKSAFGRLRKKMDCATTIKTIMVGVRIYSENANPDSLCHPTTWLNGDRWEDDPSGIGSGDKASRRADNAMLGAYEERERTPISEAVF